MIIENVKIYGEDRRFVSGRAAVKDGRFTDPDLAGGEVIDGEGCYMIPGLIDIHFHGCMGDDFCDAGPETIANIAAYEASVGVTSICPATMTLAEGELRRIMRNAAEYQKASAGEMAEGRRRSGAKLAGINMEGPFINPEKKGAQAADHIRSCDACLFRQLQEDSGGLIKLVDIAPETEGAMEFIREIKEEAVISIAHTTADYDTAAQALREGASHVTHLYNAMPPLNHRDPGVIGAARDDSNCRAELICDGVHIHPSVVRATFAMFGPERIILISDSMRAAGLTDGQYTLGGQDVFVKGSLATLADGTIAGSVTDLMGCLQTAVRKMGISLEDAVACATMNPAKEIGIYDRCGSISAGKDADFVLLDQELNVKAVYINGIKVL